MICKESPKYVIVFGCVCLYACLVDCAIVRVRVCGCACVCVCVCLRVWLTGWLPACVVYLRVWVFGWWLIVRVCG